MKALGRTQWLLVLLSVGTCVALGGTARAQECPMGCNMQGKACLQTSRVAKLSCKQDCRTNTPPTGLGACMMGCMTTSRAAKDTCVSDHATCMGTCTPPSPPPGGSACLGTCGQDLATCARGVVADAKSCASECGTGADRLTCLQGCAATAKAEAATCASDFATCVAGCGVTTPTTTLPPIPSCEMSSAPACGGSCPGATQCVAVTPTQCACMGG